jgi:hypothetical protein
VCRDEERDAIAIVGTQTFAEKVRASDR